MDNSFILTVEHDNKEQDLQAELQPVGYTYRIAVTIRDKIIFFEPDEEGSYRALIYNDPEKKGIDVGLVAAVARKLQEVFR